MAKRFVSYLNSHLELRADQLRLVVQKIQKILADTETEFVQGVRDATRGMEEEEKTEYGNNSADEQMLLIEAAQFARQSMLIAAYAHFEDSLKRICRHATQLGMTTQKVKLKGFHIKDAKDFLTAISIGSETFDAAQFGSEWNEINDGWRLIRNSFVHDNGVVEFYEDVPVSDTAPATTGFTITEEGADAPAIRTFIKGRTDMEMTFGRLVLEDGAVESFFTPAQAVVQKLTAELERIAPPSPPEPYTRP